MRNEKLTKILVCGTYFSGSSALTDLLTEYSSVVVIPGEFEEFRRRGMIGDHISGKIRDDYKCNIDIRIKNNLSTLYAHDSVKPKNYLKYLFTISPLRMFHEKSGLKYKRMKLLQEVKRNIGKSTSIEQKILAGSKWIDEISKLYTTDENFILFDQPIFFNQHINTWPLIFQPYKLIIVLRDPRDQVSDLIRNKKLYFDIETPTRGNIEMFGEGRGGAIKYEMATNYARMKNASNLQLTHGEENVMIIKFEELILDYNNTKKNIETFLSLSSSDHALNKKLLDTSISKSNIGIYKKYLRNKEEGLFEDIMKLYYSI